VQAQKVGQSRLETVFLVTNVSADCRDIHAAAKLGSENLYDVSFAVFGGNLLHHNPIQQIRKY
jgi:hypothetical protein